METAGAIVVYGIQSPSLWLFLHILWSGKLFSLVNYTYTTTRRAIWLTQGTASAVSRVWEWAWGGPDEPN